jgi:hypothetical protein
MTPLQVLACAFLIAIASVSRAGARDLLEVLGVNSSIDKAAGDMQLL